MKNASNSSISNPSSHHKKITSLLLGLLLTGLCLTGTGCEMKLPPMPWDPPADPKAAHGETGEGGEEASATGEEGGTEESGPLDETALLPPAMHTLPYEEMSIPLKDQLIVYGRLYDPSQKPEGEEGEEEAATTEESEDGEYQGTKYPLVILLHGLNRNHVVWSDLPASLVKAGYAVFAMDLRGHGKSTLTARKNRVSWRLFKPEHWLTLPQDVSQIIQYFQKNEDYPQIDGSNVALIGEKLGANVAVYAAKEKHAEVKALILISPGLDYKGIIPSQAIVDYQNPALLITSEDDVYSYQSTERLYNWLLGRKTLQVYKKIGDGSDMLNSQRTALGQQMTEWLTKNMPASVTPTDTATEAAPADPAHPEPSTDAKHDPEAAHTSDKKEG